jgi:hypothetical protein
MGRSAERSAGAWATLTGGLEQGSQGAGLYRRPTVVLADPPSFGGRLRRSVPSARPGGGTLDDRRTGPLPLCRH